MSFLERALQALPEAALSPLAFVAYIATVAAWVWVALRDRQLRALVRGLKQVPQSQKPAYIRQVLGEVVPASITVDEWIKLKRQSYFFRAFIAAIFLVLCLAGLSAWSARKEMERVNNENLRNKDQIEKLQDQLGDAIENGKTVNGLADRLPEPPIPYVATVPRGAKGGVMRYKSSAQEDGYGIWGMSGTIRKYGDEYEVSQEVEAGFRVYEVMDKVWTDKHYGVMPGNILHYRLHWFGERKPRFALVVGDTITRIDRTGEDEIVGTLLVSGKRKTFTVSDEQRVYIYIDLPSESWRLEMRDELP